MDTSPDCSGENVKPQVHKRYNGNPIVLPGDNSQVLTIDQHPHLKDQLGNDIITSDGTTLLGADNKAGVAEIMDAVNFLVKNPQVKHGPVRILFTPDEEIGRGTDHVDMAKLNAKFGYTIDGETAGCIEDETFSADGVTITITGVSTHPGFAKGKMESAIKIGASIIDRLPKDRFSPETTEFKEGFMHPVAFIGSLEEVKLKFIIRDFDDDGLHTLEELLKKTAQEVLKCYPGSKMDFKVTEQYRNMKSVLDKYPQVVDYALEAISRTGLKAIKTSIRGGTDGSRLSFEGLPCPNIFAGEHAFHSKQEWVSVQDMQKAVETIVHLCAIWEEKS
jgi:tripeptide aminopeptidase